MKLYYAPGTCAVACWIALEWAGADYEVEKVQLGTDEYRKINPLGAVPALDIGEGIVRSELAAILRYILNKYPEKDLGADESPEDKFQFDEIMAFMTGDFHPSFEALFAPARLTTSTDEAEHDRIKQKSFETIDQMMTYLDRLIGDGDHVYKNKKRISKHQESFRNNRKGRSCKRNLEKITRIRKNFGVEMSAPIFYLSKYSDIIYIISLYKIV